MGFGGEAGSSQVLMRSSSPHPLPRCDFSCPMPSGAISAVPVVYHINRCPVEPRHNNTRNPFPSPIGHRPFGVGFSFLLLAVVYRQPEVLGVVRTGPKSSNRGVNICTEHYSTWWVPFTPSLTLFGCKKKSAGKCDTDEGRLT